MAIPNRPSITFLHLVLDFNGTLALDGALLPGISEALRALNGVLTIHILTADTFGTAGIFAERFGFDVERLPPDEAGGPAKAAFVEALGPEGAVAMGNGANDQAMLQKAALAIVVLGPEGAASVALSAADIVVSSPLDGLGLLLHPKRLAATLRP